MGYTVAIFMVDLAYGGPEEGGWYYDCGYPSTDHLEYIRGFTTEEDAVFYCQQLNESVVVDLNKGRHPISSVLSEGRYTAIVCDGTPKPYPRTRPHYE